MAAVLACGPHAVASHRSAAALHELRADARSSTDVTAPNRRGHSVAGIDAQRPSARENLAPSGAAEFAAAP